MGSFSPGTSSETIAWPRCNLGVRHSFQGPKAARSGRKKHPESTSRAGAGGATRRGYSTISDARRIARSSLAGSGRR